MTNAARTRRLCFMCDIALPWYRAIACRRSPLGDAAVRVTPHRVAPAMAYLRHFAHLRLVHFDTETRALRDRHEAVFVFEDFRVLDVVEQIVALVVVDAEALFLDERVVADGVDLQARG